MPNAARLTDLTQHAGEINTGSEDVLINGLPVARILDNHSCPSDTDGTPHIGGPIVQGSPTVIINGLLAARVGDALLCFGPSQSNGSEHEPDEGAKLSHEGTKKFKEMKDKKFGSQKFDERGRPPKHEKDPLLKFNYDHEYLGDTGSLGEIADGQVKLGAGEYHVKSNINAEINSIKDIKAQLNAVDIEGSAAAVKWDPGEADLGIGTVSGDVQVLKVDGAAKLGAELNTKKGEAFIGGDLGAGGSVLAGKITGETKPIKIPGTTWGITLSGEGSGSVLTAEARAHAGLRINKKGVSLRIGGKIGAFIAGFGFDLGISIGPVSEPVVIPMDYVATGSPTVFIGG